MIYELIQKSEIDFIKAIQSLMDSGKFCFNQNVFYLYLEKEDKKLLTTLSEYFEINNKIGYTNYCSITNTMCQLWCKEKLEMELLKNFEKSEEGQKRLKMASEYIEKIIKDKEVDNIASKENGNVAEKTNDTTEV